MVEFKLKNICKAIVIKNNGISEGGFAELQKSSKILGNDFEIERFDAIVPETVDDELPKRNLVWNYPWIGSEIDFDTDLRKSAYATKTPQKRIACALSHLLLWEMCYNSKQNMIILEHDALFIKKIPCFSNIKYDIIGLNDPRGATFNSDKYHQLIQSNEEEFQQVPSVAKEDVPQGLAGNSAYYITPSGAGNLLKLVNKYGLWPNDAIMCKQLIPNIGVSRTYYTITQNLKSTTTL